MDQSNIPIHLHNHCAVSTIQFDLSEELLRVFGEELMHVLYHSKTIGVVLDLSAIAILDKYNMIDLMKVVNKCKVMGVEAVICGLRPTLVAALVSQDIDVDGLKAFHTLDSAMEYCLTLKR